MIITTLIIIGLLLIIIERQRRHIKNLTAATARYKKIWVMSKTRRNGLSWLQHQVPQQYEMNPTEFERQFISKFRLPETNTKTAMPKVKGTNTSEVPK